MFLGPMFARLVFGSDTRQPSVRKRRRLAGRLFRRPLPRAAAASRSAPPPIPRRVVLPPADFGIIATGGRLGGAIARAQRAHGGRLYGVRAATRISRADRKRRSGFRGNRPESAWARFVAAGADFRGSPRARQHPAQKAAAEFGGRGPARDFFGVRSGVWAERGEQGVMKIGGCRVPARRPIQITTWRARQPQSSRITPSA